jgi:hypothetical protein
MWAWAIGGLAAAGVGLVWAGNPGCHCGPCLGGADTRVAPAAARPVRFDEPPLAAALRPPIPNRPSRPTDPF